MTFSWLVLLFGWLDSLNIDWGYLMLCWVLQNLQCIVGKHSCHFPKVTDSLFCNLNGRQFACRQDSGRRVWNSLGSAVALFMMKAWQIPALNQIYCNTEHCSILNTQPPLWNHRNWAADDVTKFQITKFPLKIQNSAVTKISIHFKTLISSSILYGFYT